jgi:hypothetical protein
MSNLPDAPEAASLLPGAMPQTDQLVNIVDFILPFDQWRARRLSWGEGDAPNAIGGW